MMLTQPVDRGPSVAEAKRIMRTWQYAVTGKVSVASALSELKVDHIKHGEKSNLRFICPSLKTCPLAMESGGPMGMQIEACKHIESLGLDDTFYIVDLGNVQRMYKVTIIQCVVCVCRGGRG